MAKKIQTDVESFARIRVVGMGGSGKNAVNHMINSKVKGVEFVVINTDAQDLHKSLAKKKIHIGKNLTRGLGAGMNPEVGKRAAEETREEIQEALKGSDMVFITGGMGGGTGTGASPVVAKIAKELGALTVAVVTKPFSFEGQQRMNIADSGLAELKESVDAYIVIQNDKLLTVVDQNTTSKNAFAICDGILSQAVEGVSDIISISGDINTDFNDIKRIMEGAGPALMGIGVAEGDTRAKDAAEMAINSPLLDISIAGSKGYLLAIAGGDDLGILEVQEAAEVVKDTVGGNAEVILGIMKDEKLKKGQVRVIVIATGFADKGNTGVDRGSSLFSLSRKEQEEERDRIYNTVIPKKKEKEEGSKKEMEVEEKSEKKEHKKPEPVAPEVDESNWGAIPNFLRRNKK